jgi:hypothetical protein
MKKTRYAKAHGFHLIFRAERNMKSVLRHFIKAQLYAFQLVAFFVSQHV